MATTAPEKSAKILFNLPNQITSARLVLAVVMFGFLGQGWYLTSFVLFLVAAGTDWLDGYWARKYGQVTQLGRILDPFADKLIVCGTFIYLIAVPQSKVQAWMAVVIFGREILVTALRSSIEERGGDFSAGASGKLKMVLQCVAISFCVFRLSYLDPTGQTTWTTVPPDWMTTGAVLTVWAAVLVTVYSGIEYVFAAIRLLRG